MTREQQINDIREACIKANPEIGQLIHPFNQSFIHPTLRPIRLADVLLAMDKEETRRDHNWLRTCYKWDLPKDDLTEQSDECLEFLVNLIVL